MNPRRFYIVKLNKFSKEEYNNIVEAFKGFYIKINFEVINNNYIKIITYDKNDFFKIEDLINELDFDVEYIFQSLILNNDLDIKFDYYFKLLNNTNYNKFFIRESDIILKNINISNNLKNIYLKNIDKDLLKSILTFINSDLSVNKASKLLFVHRNTLNNKINKFKNLTGFDVRNFNDAYIVYTLLK